MYIEMFLQFQINRKKSIKIYNTFRIVNTLEQEIVNVEYGINKNDIL